MYKKRKNFEEFQLNQSLNEHFYKDLSAMHTAEVRYVTIKLGPLAVSS